ncbi:MAG: sigma-70 family RNA polymerase sigma factor [Anaerolineae bacterium]|uniref:RNA polymerase sigma factor n=1 Tax=Candidatus Amarolinea dominans TaxID=3140696 RepID=UPI0031367A97|nr:sigma-70 family RNA polymerase sigma factor [Anaerolineae bacterium]
MAYVEVAMLSQAQSTTAAPRALEELFERLYVQYHRPLFSYVLRLVGHWEQAEDLTQETFVKAYHALARLPADSNYRAWLYRIATNTCYDALRRKRLIQWLPFFDDDAGPQTDSPEHATAEALAVRTALAQLPADQRTCLVLYIYDSFSTEEIAQVMGCSRGAVKTRLFRARERFRQVYVGVEERRP